MSRGGAEPQASSPTVAPPDAFNEEDYYIHGHKRTIVLIGLGLVLFISVLDSTIVSVALPVIGADFNDYTETSWIVTAYLITYTAFLPVVSKFTDILGRRPILIFSSLFFMVGLHFYHPDKTTDGSLPPYSCLPDLRVHEST